MMITIEAVKTTVRRYQNRFTYRLLKFRLERRLKELHYMALQRAADQFHERVLLSEIRQLQLQLEGEPVDLVPLTSSNSH